MIAFGFSLVHPTQLTQFTAVAIGSRVVSSSARADAPLDARLDRDFRSGTQSPDEARKDACERVLRLYRERTALGYRRRPQGSGTAEPQTRTMTGIGDATGPAQVIAAFLSRATPSTAESLQAEAQHFLAARDEPAPLTTPDAAPALDGVPGTAPDAPRLIAAEPVSRPNGERYRPRDLDGHSDVAVLRRLRDLGVPVRVYGPPGAGKTALVEASFAAEGVITVNGHGDLTVAHFAGSLLPAPSGGWTWVDGPLTQAMKLGRVLFVDEITRIPAEVLAVLYSAMDGRGVLRLDDRPDTPEVAAAPGFFVVAGYNPDTVGSQRLDEALVSRFRVGIEVRTDLGLAAELGVPPRAIGLARRLAGLDTADRANGGPGVWVPQMRELLTFRDLTAGGLGEGFAAAALAASCPTAGDLPTVLAAAAEAFGTTIDVPRLGGAQVL